MLKNRPLGWEGRDNLKEFKKGGRELQKRNEFQKKTSLVWGVAKKTTSCKKGKPYGQVDGKLGESSYGVQQS